MDAPLDEQKKYSKALDRSIQVALGRLTGGLSPGTLTLAFLDWYMHLITHPAKQFELLHLYQHHFWQSIYLYAAHATNTPIESKERFHDKRFADPSWQQFPFNFIHESFLLMQNWWQTAATNIPGVNCHHEHIVDFTLRQILDMISPANSPFTNPEVQRKTEEKHGENFLRGFENFLDDLRRYQMNEPPAGAEKFIIGENLASSKGKVIYRNRLIELIQYSPLTHTVYENPVLITPAWIMKYYILDLVPKHSLVKYLVKKGHTVFMISWKNPKKKDRNIGLEDYLDLGIMSSLNVINTIIPQQKIHLVGYCLGGTLAAIAAAAMARDDDHRLKSLTLLAAQTDFTEPGELGLFIDESQISFIESLMSENGYLDTHQMAGAFQLLRSNDLIWSRMIHDYLLGERKPLTDLMAWNADATRLPYKMHSEYLRQLFLHNQLAEGKYQVKGKIIALPDVNIPIFVVATERDHVSPWQSVFKINILTSARVTFTLTSGGHNVGIVSLPSKKTKRHFRISTPKLSEKYIDAETWYKSTKPILGSWWPAWEKWLVDHSGDKIPCPTLGSNDFPPIENAPGSYVLMK